jgi:ATP-dependent DNA helicase RecQ
MEKYSLLKQVFGYDEFRDGQALLIDHLVNNNDVIGIMPTGAGKSIIFQIAALMLDGVTIVVSPLISLMNDQVMALDDLKVPAAFLNSQMRIDDMNEVFLRLSKKEIKLLYVAPERLQNEYFLNRLNTTNVSMVVIDEAHCVSQWGTDFRPSYLQIKSFIDSLHNQPVIGCFTATATKRVEEDIQSLIGLMDPVIVKTGYDRPNLNFEVLQEKNKEDVIVSYLRSHQSEVGIIYCNTRKNVEFMHQYLLDKGIKSSRYHAGLSIEERKKSLEDFVYDRSDVMVATNAFGMGIDKSNVRFVIHYNIPMDLESYYQEAGRAGRDQLESDCLLFYSPQDISTNRFLIENSESKTEFSEMEKAEIKELSFKRLNQMQYYATTKKCLRAYILNYFGDYSIISCGKCQNCIDYKESIDIQDEAVQVIKGIYELKTSFGQHTIADFLRGSKAKKIIDRGLDRLDSYNCMPKKSKEELLELMNYLLIEGLLKVSNSDLPTISITDKGFSFINNPESLMMRISKHSSKDNDNKSTSKSIEHNETLNYDLFNELKRCRLSLAKEKGLPPYIIFNDRTLKELSIYQPMNRDEMLKINGVGMTKYDSYGELFLSIIQNYKINKSDKDLDISVKNQVSETPAESVELSQSDQLIYNKLKEFRLKIAREKSVPAYTIFTNKTLISIVMDKPQTIDALGSIRGVSIEKAQLYGELIISTYRFIDDDFEVKDKTEYLSGSSSNNVKNQTHMKKISGLKGVIKKIFKY